MCDDVVALELALLSPEYKPKLTNMRYIFQIFSWELAYAHEPPSIYSIFTLSPDLSRFKSTNNKSQLYHTDIHVQVLIAFND